MDGPGTLLLLLALAWPGSVPLGTVPVPVPGAAAEARAQTAPAKAAPMSHATGTFDVNVAPTNHAPEPTLSSSALDKTYHGDLEGTGKGEMLGAGDPASGNAGYVALERVRGTLAGKSGSFALMQSGTMSGGSLQMSVQVVPGSGTGDLSGLYGTMVITIAGGKHSYVLDYAFSR